MTAQTRSTTSFIAFAGAGARAFTWQELAPIIAMENPFPKLTLVVALCLSTSSLLAHAVSLAAFHRGSQKANRIFQRRQTLYSATAFGSTLLALLIAQFPEINASPKSPLAWYFLSVVFLEVQCLLNTSYGKSLTKGQGDRRQLLAYNNPNTSKMSEMTLSLMPLLLYLRPLPLLCADPGITRDYLTNAILATQ